MSEVDWGAFVARVRSYPPKVHLLMPPCPPERLAEVERAIGALPEVLRMMLNRFCGAELFISGIPFVTIFGVSTVPPLPPLEWAPDWYIDKFLSKWRTTESRQYDWPIAKMNYGGLALLRESGSVRVWDTQAAQWCSKETPLPQWLESLWAEGEETMKG